MNKEDQKLHLYGQLSEDEKIAIKSFLQGTVFCWCKNCEYDYGDQKQFGLNDLVGESTPANWKDTPLLRLYDLYKEHSDYGDRSSLYIGKILHELLDSNKRFFHEEQKGVCKYKWNGE